MLRYWMRGKRPVGPGTRQARVVLKLKPQFEAALDASADEPGLSTQNDAVAPIDEPEEVIIARRPSKSSWRRCAKANVSVRMGESDANRIQPVLIDIEGADLSFLIGRKAETINALQFITSLIVSREVGRWIPLQIDVQKYRRRRADELRKLARRIADQVVSTGRQQALEPMPPNERRIVHIELRDHPEVETESDGEDPKRKVVVRLKR